jgi:hypothetical protein
MLEKMSQEDSVFFILLGTMLNEINMLNKVIASLSPKEGVSDVEHKADLAQLLFFRAGPSGREAVGMLAGPEIKLLWGTGIQEIREPAKYGRQGESRLLEGILREELMDVERQKLVLFPL